MADSFSTYFRDRARALALKRPPIAPPHTAAALKEAARKRAAFSEPVNSPKISPRAALQIRQREFLKDVLSRVPAYARTIVSHANAQSETLATRTIHPVRCTEHTHVDIQRRLSEPVHYPPPAPLKIDGVERTPEEHNLFILQELEAHRRRLAARITAIKAASK